MDSSATTRTARVICAVTNPSAGEVPWDVTTDRPLTQLLPSVVSRLSQDIGWIAPEYANAGNGSMSAATPISIDLLAIATETVPGSHICVAPADLPTQANGNRIAAIEGHPAWSLD